MMKESSEKLNNQAINLASSGNFDEAVACLKRAITVEQDNYLLWFNLGITYRDMGNFQAAKSAMKKAFEIMPEDMELVCELALLCFAMDQKEEAISFCSAGLSYNSDNAKLWNTLGIISFNMENYKTAEYAFEEAISINPFFYDAIYNLHDTYEQLGNTAGAEECKRLMQNLDGNKK